MQRSRPRYANKPVYPADALLFALMRKKGGAPLRKMASAMLDGKEKIMTIDSIKRYTVSGDIAYPIHEDPEGDYVSYEDHVAAIEPYQQRIEELEAELQELRRQWVEHDTLGCPTAKTGIYATKADRQRRGEPVAWLYEDELPDNYPYDTMFPYSKVDGVRMFPVFAPQPAEPVKVPSDDERAAQGLPPYSPRHLTEEEWNRLIENGRKAWGKKPTKPVEVPRPHEFNTGNEKLDTLLDDTYYLVEDGGMDNAIKWHESLKEFLASIEPVKVPSDDDSLTIAYMSGYHDGKRSMTPEGWKLVPVEPTDEQWGDLARDIIKAWDFDMKRPRELFKFLEMSGTPIPQWMREEQEMKNLDHMPSKGTRAVLIYKAMLEAAPEFGEEQ